jgi:hypothetical protein
MVFISFRNGGKGHELPRFLLQDVTYQIIFVQPLHDQNDHAKGFAVEPAIERMAKPLVHLRAL